MSIRRAWLVFVYQICILYIRRDNTVAVVQLEGKKNILNDIILYYTSAVFTLYSLHKMDVMW